MRPERWIIELRRASGRRRVSIDRSTSWTDKQRSPVLPAFKRKYSTYVRILLAFFGCTGDTLVDVTYKRSVVLGHFVHVVVVGFPVVVIFVFFFAQRRRVVLNDLGLFAGHAVRLAFGLPFGGHRDGR